MTTRSEPFFVRVSLKSRLLQDRQAQRFEISRRYRPKLRTPVVQSVLARRSLCRKCEAEIELLIVAPGDAEAGRYVRNSGECAYSTRCTSW